MTVTNSRTSTGPARSASGPASAREDERTDDAAGAEPTYDAAGPRPCKEAIPSQSTVGVRGSAAGAVAPLMARLFPRGLPVRFVFWDGSSLGPKSGAGRVTLHSPNALRRLLWAPGELGVARAFVAGDLDAEGDAYEILRLLHQAANSELSGGFGLVAAALRAAGRLRVLGPPPAPPAEESRLRGRQHSPRRDRQAVTHHYDVGNEFYQLVLGPTMTYSCGRFARPELSLEEAQTAKHELVSRKLGLPEMAGRPGRPARLLDVGCGWGSMALHAASQHRAEVVGVTLSPAQVQLAERRVRDAGLDGAVDIRLQDYRDLRGETFDAISSIGMFEHVGERKMAEYFATLAGLLRPGGRLLNHAISSVGGSKLGRRSFVGRYVFPDGELIDVADVVRAMERAGFEVRDVESLREHYSATLHAWVANLEEHWERAVALVGTARARIWWLYMSASANGFDDGGLSIHQVLAVLPGPGGESGMPRTRDGW
ncbi:MAG TPA: cyclopropane-fatty-acyl-phospholipid synthase family protein [Acidimicrobiales bacterium]|nr:cyclopropane-fatty-acyl-phospholipid synthase family protein [Acidimicrobiales bacterium]